MTQIVERATDLQFRIWAEFRTMPGLRLTRNQACRLFGGESNKVVDGVARPGRCRSATADRAVLRSRRHWQLHGLASDRSLPAGVAASS